MSSRLPAAVTALVAISVAYLFRIIIYSPISPNPLHLPWVPSSAFPSNDILQGVVKIGEGIVDRPEDLAVDKEGSLYTATRDGWIKKLHKNGSWEEWRMMGGSSMLGMATAVDGGLLVCDAEKGLLKVDEGGVTVVASEVEGSKIRFADDVIQGADGNIYLSDASTKFGFHEWILDLLEAEPHGRVLKHDPSTGTTSLLLSHLAFPNGVALSSEQHFLVICESWKFRCLKHWLKGPSQGKTETLIENLPGAPDNVNLAEDGTFWIALLGLRSTGLDILHSSKVAKRIVAAFPTLWQKLGERKTRAMVINVGEDGKVKQMLDDSRGKVVTFVTSAVEYEGYLYLGSLLANFIVITTGIHLPGMESECAPL
ncbi:hypothetical protein H6P81_002535 [Aristolochia fimbriata]|uniref:Strictosidine synthase conserved region domain-containing protein n=1 Tax=Aristolochia fimbriata TaxID=158543 RepID=A0AAV7FE52_ARIFI|nr:hypothetical protein H6P81_002535 [Aristolochia fimbriata]